MLRIFRKLSKKLHFKKHNLFYFFRTILSSWPTWADSKEFFHIPSVPMYVWTPPFPPKAYSLHYSSLLVLYILWILEDVQHVSTIIVSYRYMCAVCLIVQSCPTLCYPMDCSPPGSSCTRLQIRVFILFYLINTQEWKLLDCLVAPF